MDLKPEEFYKKRLHEAAAELKNLEAKEGAFVWYRLAAFLGGAVFIYYIIKTGSLHWGVSLIPIGIFLQLVSIHEKLIISNN